MITCNFFPPVSYGEFVPFFVYDSARFFSFSGKTLYVVKEDNSLYLFLYVAFSAFRYFSTFEFIS